MADIKQQLEQLKNQTWGVAKQSLDSGETAIYRSLTEMAEKLTKLIRITEIRGEVINENEGMVNIFAKYKGKKFEAKLDEKRIDTGRGYCILLEGRWWTASGSVRHITNTSVNGWCSFWKYIDESSNTEQPIDKLRRSE